jgi:predicted RNase H-like nuclease (RuvC/YqgF family)
VESPQQTFPSAEEISRANTTPEIQENLRSDTAAISEGLQADAAVQSAANARQLAQAADGAQESGRNEVVDEGREQVQDLRTEVRELERLQTEARREIQDLENDIRRAQGA